MALVQPLASGNVMTNGSAPSCTGLPAKAPSSTLASPHQQLKQESQQPAGQAAPAEADAPEEEQEVDITINNVVCSFSVRCHLDLRYIAMNADNVEYRRENGVSVPRAVLLQSPRWLESVPGEWRGSSERLGWRLFEVAADRGRREGKGSWCRYRVNGSGVWLKFGQAHGHN